MLLIFMLISLFANIDLIFCANEGDSCLIEGDKLPVINYCNLYLECIRGIFVNKSCDLGEVFDYEGNNCIQSSLKLFDCQSRCNFTYNKPVKGNIRKYIYCENGIIKHGKCEEYFDRFSKKCMLFVNNDYLINKGNLNSVTQRNEKLINRCTHGMKKSVEGNCASFMECDESSVWVFRKCDDCKNFDPKSMNCVWSWKYSCETPIFSTTASSKSSSTTSQQLSSSSTTIFPQSSSTIITTGKTPTKMPSTISSISTNEPNTHSTPNQSSSLSTPSPTPNTSAPGPSCKNGDKKVFKTGDCKDYLECDSNKWVKKSCSYGYSFDKNKLDCTWSWWAKC